jgi:hypothetical protein
MGLDTAEPRVTEEGVSAARCTEPRASPPPGEEEAIPEQTPRGRECSPGSSKQAATALGRYLTAERKRARDVRGMRKSG